MEITKQACAKLPRMAQAATEPVAILAAIGPVADGATYDPGGHPDRCRRPDAKGR